jgi:hypothetical protein
VSTLFIVLVTEVCASPLAELHLDTAVASTMNLHADEFAVSQPPVPLTLIDVNARCTRKIWWLPYFVPKPVGRITLWTIDTPHTGGCHNNEMWLFITTMEELSAVLTMHHCTNVQ